KFSADGALLWSTFFGGTGAEWALALTATRIGCYLTGHTFSSNFPVKRAFDSTYNGGYDAFVSKFATNGSLLWSTYLGGRGGDKATGIAVNREGRCFVIGYTYSTNFPLQQAFDPTLGSSRDAFISIFIEPTTPIKYHALFGFFVLVSVTFLAVLVYHRKK
ncbi:MAG: SBBP repeat-containing protein, partial [Candidatus Heimdallarchaeota archaeon]